ncbi:sequence-specific DNA binding transcription factors, partial [Striga asiatica]
MKDTHGGIHSATNKIKSCTSKQRKKEHINEQGIQQHQMIDSNSGIIYDLTNSSSYAVNNCETKEKAPINQVSLTTLKGNYGWPKTIFGNTSAQTDLEKITGTPNTTISSEIFDHRADDQVTVTTLKRKRGRP